MEIKMQLKPLEETPLVDRLEGEEAKPIKTEFLAKNGKPTLVSTSNAHEENSQQALPSAVDLDNRDEPSPWAAKPLDTLKPGLEIGPANHRFCLVRLISTREISRVWLAQDLSPERLADEPLYKALKIFAPQLQELARAQEASVRDDNKAARLELINLRALLAKLRVKAELAVKLNHPAIAKVYGWRQGEDGWPFLEMEYADQRAGCSLDRLLSREGKPGLGLERTLKLLSQVAEALEYAHRQHRLVHQALQARNVFLSDQGVVKVLNFGLSDEAREPRDIAASPEITDPAQDSQLAEQTRFKQDVSALAALAYQLLTGNSPYRQTTSALGLAKLPRPAELNEAAWQALQQSLDHQSERCPSSAVELLRYLGAAKGASESAGRRCSKSLVWLLVLIVLSVITGIGWYIQ